MLQRRAGQGRSGFGAGGVCREGSTAALPVLVTDKYTNRQVIADIPQKSHVLDGWDWNNAFPNISDLPGLGPGDITSLEKAW